MEPVKRLRKGRLNMKTIIAIIMTWILLLTSVAMAENQPLTIQRMTELGDIQKKLDQGITITKAYYTDGYGFSTSEFTTDDPKEIDHLWKTVNAITVGSRVNESVTDWYPQIVFTLSDGTSGGVRFEGEWLSVGGRDNYEIGNAEKFRSLTADLVLRHAEAGAETDPDVGDDVIDGGWGAATDPTITDEVRTLFDRAMEGLVGVNYVPVAYLGSQIVAGYGHAILCQATTVYPGAAPRWVIVYLFEALDGSVSITDIADLNW